MKKPPVKPTPKPAPVKPPVVSPPAPPTPDWQRLDLPDNCARFEVDQYVSHRGAIVSSFDASGNHIYSNTYGKGYVNIIPPAGKWVEQTLDYTNTYQATGVTVSGSVNLTLDGGVGPAKLMRYLKV